MIGFVSMTRFATSPVPVPPWILPRCAIASFIASVLPAPDSPEMRIDCERRGPASPSSLDGSIMRLCVLPTSAYTCGGSSRS